MTQRRLRGKRKEPGKTHDASTMSFVAQPSRRLSNSMRISKANRWPLVGKEEEFKTKDSPKRAAAESGAPVARPKDEANSPYDASLI
jgi:hypothetical protein